MMAIIAIGSGLALSAALGLGVFMIGFWDFTADEWRAFRDDPNSDGFERTMARVFLLFRR